MQHIAEILNQKAKRREPFLFVIDYDLKKLLCYPLPVSPDIIKVKFPNYCNVEHVKLKKQEKLSLKKEPISFNDYEKSFDEVMKNLRRGNTFLLNLTMPTRIETSLTIEEIFLHSRAPYNICLPNKFVVFSPEIFIRIEKNTIRSFPMKGTIDANIPNAENIILSDSKEIDEHHTIVDLIRNDLNKISTRVRVERFRYIDRIKTENKELFQVSSEICGDLEQNWQNRFGDILMSLLPAGSISGAPKNKTLQIIDEVEMDKRGFYTGIMGIFDGENVESAVMIRYIEKSKNRLVYRSGGGITINSDPKSEYNEMIDKIYVPLY